MSSSGGKCNCANQSPCKSMRPESFKPSKCPCLKCKQRAMERRMQQGRELAEAAAAAGAGASSSGPPCQQCVGPQLIAAAQAGNRCPCSTSVAARAQSNICGSMRPNCGSGGNTAQDSMNRCAQAAQGANPCSAMQGNAVGSAVVRELCSPGPCGAVAGVSGFGFGPGRPPGLGPFSGSGPDPGGPGNPGNSGGAGSGSGGGGINVRSGPSQGVQGPVGIRMFGNETFNFIATICMEILGILVFFAICTITFWITVGYYIVHLLIDLKNAQRNVQIVVLVIVSLLVIAFAITLVTGKSSPCKRAKSKSLCVSAAAAPQSKPKPKSCPAKKPQSNPCPRKKCASSSWWAKKKTSSSCSRSSCRSSHWFSTSGLRSWFGNWFSWIWNWRSSSCNTCPKQKKTCSSSSPCGSGNDISSWFSWIWKSKSSSCGGKNKQGSSSRWSFSFGFSSRPKCCPKKRSTCCDRGWFTWFNWSKITNWMNFRNLSIWKMWRDCPSRCQLKKKNNPSSAAAASHSHSCGAGDGDGYSWSWSSLRTTKCNKCSKCINTKSTPTTSRNSCHQKLPWYRRYTLWPQRTYDDNQGRQIMTHLNRYAIPSEMKQPPTVMIWLRDFFWRMRNHRSSLPSTFSQ